MILTLKILLIHKCLNMLKKGLNAIVYLTFCIVHSSIKCIFNNKLLQMKTHFNSVKLNIKIRIMYFQL